VRVVQGDQPSPPPPGSPPSGRALSFTLDHCSYSTSEPLSRPMGLWGPVPVDAVGHHVEVRDAGARVCDAVLWYGTWTNAPVAFQPPIHGPHG